MRTCDSWVFPTITVHDASRRGIVALNAPAIDYPRAGDDVTESVGGSGRPPTRNTTALSEGPRAPLLFIPSLGRAVARIHPPRGKSYGLSGFRVHRVPAELHIAGVTGTPALMVTRIKGARLSSLVLQPCSFVSFSLSLSLFAREFAP